MKFKNKEQDSEIQEFKIKNNESVIHIITLLRIKPSDRAYFMNNLKI